MTVKELIEKLESEDDDDEVFISACDSCSFCESIEHGIGFITLCP
jgi:hypothetical protein